MSWVTCRVQGSHPTLNLKLDLILLFSRSRPSWVTWQKIALVITYVWMKNTWRCYDFMQIFFGDLHLVWLGVVGFKGWIWLMNLNWINQVQYSNPSNSNPPNPLNIIIIGNSRILIFYADYRNLRPEVEEGICQVLSHMWLESEVIPISRNTPSTSSSAAPSSSTWSYGSTSMAPSSSSSSWSSSKKGRKSSVENKLGEFFMHQIAHDASPAYGGGYRAAMAAVNKYGLRRTLDHVRFTGTFPE